MKKEDSPELWKLIHEAFGINPDESLLDQQIAKREAELSKSQSEKAARYAREDSARQTAAQTIADKEAAIERDYHQFILPLETRYTFEAERSEVARLFDDFNAKLYAKTVERCWREKTIDWGAKEKRDILQAYQRNHDLRPKSIAVNYMRDMYVREGLSDGSGGHRIGIYVRCGFGWAKKKDYYKFYMGGYSDSYDGNARQLSKVTNLMASVLVDGNLNLLGPTVTGESHVHTNDRIAY